jgi:predicted neuraminidase
VPKPRPGAVGGVCEPALVEIADGDLFMLMRTGTSWIYEARSRDGGRTWSGPRRSPLAGHNAPMALWRLDENPKEVIVIWNNSPVDRYPLCVAISKDGCRSWSTPKDVAGVTGADVSYPGITQAADGTFVAVWQQFLPEGRREIRWARFNRPWVLAPGPSGSSSNPMPEP